MFSCTKLYKCTKIYACKPSVGHRKTGVTISALFIVFILLFFNRSQQYDTATANFLLVKFCFIFNIAIGLHSFNFCTNCFCNDMKIPILSQSTITGNCSSTPTPSLSSSSSSFNNIDGNSEQNSSKRARRNEDTLGPKTLMEAEDNTLLDVEIVRVDELKSTRKQCKYLECIKNHYKELVESSKELIIHQGDLIINHERKLDSQRAEIIELKSEIHMLSYIDK